MGEKARGGGKYLLFLNENMNVYNMFTFSMLRSFLAFFWSFSAKNRAWGLDFVAPIWEKSARYACEKAG